MFYLFQSDRLESLAEMCARIHQASPLDSVLAQEEVVVQSQGMRRYLNVFFARELGVAANLKFSLPAGLAWQLMRKLVPDVPPLSPFSPEVMRWRLLDLFRSEAFQTAPEYENVRLKLESYLHSSASADYQLAGQMADIFDQYLVYRPDWIDAWQAGKLLGLGDDEDWQARLWRYLDDGSQSAPHRVALWEKLLAQLDKSVLPQRLFVFGISTMAPMYLQLLHQISKHCDVFVFALNPSSQYWGEVIDEAQILKRGDEADLSQAGHPLLASLGKQGRDFFDFLSEVETEQDIQVYEEGKDDTLLHCLQNDIQNLIMPSERLYQQEESEAGAQPALVQVRDADGNPVCVEPDKLLNDGSVKIVAAHSPLRELQILKEELSLVLQNNPDWQPYDIAVLTPNIEPYSPFIEAVFGQEHAGSQALPYSISDVKLSRRQPLLYALAQTLDLLESRFEVDKVLPLLESRLVLQRFGLSEEDVPLLHDAVAGLNVHWGLDQTMREGKDNLFTWQQAVERLALGWMLPEGGNGMWQGVSAWHSNVNQLDVFSGFAEFIRTLADMAAQWQEPANVESWVQRCRALLEKLFAPDTDDQYAKQQFEQSLAKWQEEAQLAEFDGLLPCKTVIRHIRRFLDSESQAGFLSGGITFCSMVPMRSLPFKMVCLLGLNDGDFPRNTKAAVFDLIAKHPKKGDRARRDDDRYLFLEALISAREMLYLSYIGRDIRNDAEFAPSSLISELLDTIAAMTGKSGRELSEKWVKHHPLQAFSRRYFQQDALSDGLFSTRQDYADALNQPQAEAQPFFLEALSQEEPGKTIHQGELISFWRNPVKVWLKKNLSWDQPYLDGAWESAEPFEPQHEGRIADAYLDARRKGEDFEDTAIRLNAESLMPVGELGGLWQKQYQISAKNVDAELIRSNKRPSEPYEAHFDDLVLQGTIGNLYECGRIVFLNQKDNAPNRIARLLEHLIFCAVAPKSVANRQTHIVSLGQTETYAAIEQQTAKELLKEWLVYFRIGQNTPLPFFAKTSLAAAEEYNKKEDWDTALRKAHEVFNGNKMSKGQKEYTEVKLVFGHSEESPLDEPLFENLVVNLLVPLLTGVAGKTNTTEQE